MLKQIRYIPVYASCIFTIMVLTSCYNLSKGHADNADIQDKYSNLGYSFQPVDIHVIERNYAEKQMLYNSFYNVLMKLKNKPDEIDRILGYWKKQAELINASPPEFPNKENWDQFKLKARELNAKTYYYILKKNEDKMRYHEEGVLVIKDSEIIYQHMYFGGSLSE